MSDCKVILFPVLFRVCEVTLSLVHKANLYKKTLMKAFKYRYGSLKIVNSLLECLEVRIIYLIYI